MARDEPASSFTEVQIVRLAQWRREVGEHGMRIDAAHTKRTRRGAAADLRRMRAPLTGHDKPRRVVVLQEARYVGVHVPEVQRRHGGRRLYGCKGKQAPGQAGRSLAVPHRGLGRHHPSYTVKEYRGNTANLDGIAQNGASAMARYG